MRCIDEFLNLKFYFEFDFRIYNWYVKICIDLNFDLEWFLVHVHMICRCMYKLKILFDLIHNLYMRYKIAYLDHNYSQYDSWFVYEIYDIMYWSKFLFRSEFYIHIWDICLYVKSEN